MMTAEQQAKCEQGLITLADKCADGEVPLGHFLDCLRDALMQYPRTDFVRPKIGVAKTRYSHQLDIDHLLSTIIKHLGDCRE